MKGLYRLSPKMNHLFRIFLIFTIVFPYRPNYDYRKELRAPHFDPTTQAFMVIETIDNQSKKDVKICGYSMINFFLNRGTKI